MTPIRITGFVCARARRMGNVEAAVTPARMVRRVKDIVEAPCRDALGGPLAAL
jgi:hypothetical protein